MGEGAGAGPRPASRTDALRYEGANRADARLLARCLDGDPGAWRVLVDHHQARLESLARREYGFCAHDAEDIVQDVLLRACKRMEQIREPAALSAWLTRLVRHACIDGLRRRRPTVELPTDIIDLAAGDECDAFLSRTALFVALTGLSPPSREVIERFFLCDESYSTISRELAIPVGTVASRIARGLDRLRAELAEEAA